MGALDWAIAAVLAVSSLVGAWRGLVFELLSLAGWAVAFFLAQWSADIVAQWLPWKEANGTLRYAAAFALVFVAGIFIWGLVAAFGRRLVEVSGLRPADRALGALFGAVRGMLLLLVAAAVVRMARLDGQEWWRSSWGAVMLSEWLGVLGPVLPGQFGRWLSSS
jgi:membrane protein required for colicin V production